VSRSLRRHGCTHVVTGEDPGGARARARGVSDGLIDRRFEILAAEVAREDIVRESLAETLWGRVEQLPLRRGACLSYGAGRVSG
jgi:hypothetical protein